MNPLGKKIEPPAPPPEVERWIPVPGRPGIEKSTQTGYLRNETPTPQAAPAPAPSAGPYIDCGGYAFAGTDDLDITLTTVDGQEVIFIKGLKVRNQGTP